MGQAEEPEAAQPADPFVPDSAKEKRANEDFHLAGSPGRFHHASPQLPPRRILIIGRHGTLATAFGNICTSRGLPYQQTTREELDITDPAGTDAFLAEMRPWAVINTAGYVRVDQAESEAEACRRINTAGPINLAEVCASLGIQLLTFSSDLVFHGCQSTPYLESQAPAPLNVYGRTKAEAEKQVLQKLPRALVVRTSAFFGPWDAHNFPILALRALLARKPFLAAKDVTISPTYVPDLVNACLDLLVDGENGIWHLVNQGEISWYDFALRLAKTAGVPRERLQGCSMEELGPVACRPRYSALGSERGLLLPPIEQAIHSFCRSREHVDFP